MENIEDTDLFADIVASHSLLKHQDKQKLLETPDLIERLRRLLGILMRENEFLKMEHEIQDKVRNEMDKGQKQYYLREQLKIIQQELGEDGLSEAEELRSRAEDTDLRRGEERSCVSLSAMRAWRRYLLKRRSPGPTSSGCWTFRGTSSEDHLNLKDARKILEEDHYGLEVKERILEFLAVRKLAADNMRAQVLCFVGPPGVGKTSLGKSIARTMGRKFVNMSWRAPRRSRDTGPQKDLCRSAAGKDNTEDQGSGTNNPVLLMDEIDKIGPTSGEILRQLCEVLDPEQNCSFTDNFLEISFDLSRSCS